MQRRRSGNVAVIVALSLTVLVAVAAMVIDLGYARVVQQQLENAADAAALAGASELDGTTAGMTDARTRAVNLAAANYAGGQTVTLDRNNANLTTGDVVLGVYNESTGAFTASTNAATVNAIEVRPRIANLQLFLAPLFLGKETTPVSARTRVMIQSGGASATQCFIPLAMASCLVTRYTVAGLQNVRLQLQPAGIDNVGYARPNASPSASWTRDQINNCTNSGEIEIGDRLGLQNGQSTTDLTAFVNAVESSTTRWSTTRWGTQPARNSKSSINASKYGRTFEGVIPVFDGGTSYCTGTGGAYNGYAPIVGFMWGAIYDVINQGSASTRTIYMRLDSMDDHNVGSAVGGPDWGITANEPAHMVH